MKVAGWLAFCILGLRAQPANSLHRGFSDHSPGYLKIVIIWKIKITTILSLYLYLWITSTACQQPPKRVFRSCFLNIVWWRPQHWFHWKNMKISFSIFVIFCSSFFLSRPSLSIFSFIRAWVSLYENQEEVIGCQLYVRQPWILLVEMVSQRGI